MSIYELDKYSESYDKYKSKVFTEQEVIDWAKSKTSEFNAKSNRIITIDDDLDKALCLLKNAGEYLIKINM